MEILTNIWNALSTENAELLTFITSPLLLVESYLILSLFSNLLNINCTKKQKTIYILLLEVKEDFSAKR